VLVDFLRANADIFAWSPSDMPGIPRDVAEHSLDIQAGARSVKQPLRRFDEEKRRAIGEEIHKLMAAGFIKEVFHPEWLANPVLVRKKGGKWRMCVDYTGLNKACPKVPYPLPRIDQIVDSTAGCETLSFLDAYSGYHQIKMKESDQLATPFITPFGMYCYVTMPFGLRNAGATYQRCMNHVFGEHIGRTAEAYVDDIVVKTRKASDLLPDLEVTFRCLKAKGVKLNQSNQASREDSLDQQEEARDKALLHSARYQQSLRRYHARGVRPRDLQVGDLVLRLRQDARGRHKLTPPWEGPFVVAKVLKPGTYKLANSQGEVYGNAWNIQQLRRFYP
jgi:hypothetical protein